MQISTPPTDSPLSFVLWALGLSLAVVVVLWRIRESEKGAEIKRLKDESILDKQEISALRTKIEKMLQERAEASAKEAEDAKKIAAVLLNREGDWDVSTSVAKAVIRQRVEESDRPPASLPRPVAPPRGYPRQIVEEQYRPRSKSKHGDEK